MPEDIRAHIAGIARRSAADTAHLTERVAAQCWPAGGREGTSPVSREWVRRWTAAVMVASIDCTCTVGRCATCN